MNRVEISVEGISPPAWSPALEAFALKVLDFFHKDAWDLSILLCGDQVIKQLNAQYRNMDEPTDILSFTLGEKLEEEGETRYLPGDLAISLETLSENALRFQVPADEELRRLVIHGILHLDGMDHRGNGPEEPMLILQEETLLALGNEKILPD